MLKVTGCDVSTPSITGGINLTFYDKCCEGEGIKEGRKYGGNISLNI